MIPFLNATARSVLAGLALGTLLAAVALPASAALSATVRAVSSTSPGFPPPASTTDVAGEVVSQSITAENFYVSAPSGTKVVIGTVNGAASASVDYGVNRISLATGRIDLRSQAGTPRFRYEFGYTSGVAETRWTDNWNIGGGTPGDLVSISLSGRTTYQFALTGITNITDTRAFGVEQSISWSTRPDFGTVVNDTADFVSRAGLGFIDWSVSFIATVGVPVNIAGGFGASGNGCCFDVVSGLDNDVRYAFSSMSTSRLQRIELPSGYTLTADSGEIVTYDGAFAYRAALVPEPQSWALLAFGLGALSWIARRRRA